MVASEICKVLLCYICILFRSNRKRKPSPESTTSESYQQSKDDQPSCSLAKNAKTHTDKFLDFYGKTEESRVANIREIIISACKDYFNNLEKTQIHNYYISKFSKCHDICSEDNTAMTKDKKFQYKLIFHQNLTYCKETGSWCLTYIDGKGIFCNFCRLTNIVHPTNASKTWNCKPNIRYRAETVKDYFKRIQISTQRSRTL